MDTALSDQLTLGSWDRSHRPERTDMSHYHSGYADGAAVERGEKAGYNQGLFVDADPGYRNGLRDGRQAVTEARVIADNLGLVTVEIAGKDGIHYMSNDDFHERLPVCGAGANVEPERLVRSEKKDATCRGCLSEARAWFSNAK